MEVLIGIAIGLLLGACAIMLIFNCKSLGLLRVDQSDPSEPPYLFLELKTNPEVIKGKKYVTLKVKIENFISHE